MPVHSHRTAAASLAHPLHAVMHWNDRLAPASEQLGHADKALREYDWFRVPVRLRHNYLSFRCWRGPPVHWPTTGVLSTSETSRTRSRRQPLLVDYYSD